MLNVDVDQARPAELTAFLRALKLGAVPESGFGVGVDDIALVEPAWQGPRAEGLQEARRGSEARHPVWTGLCVMARTVRFVTRPR